MKLMIINPDWGMTREQMDFRCRVLSQFVSQDTILHMECLEETQVYLDSVADSVFAGPEIIKMAMQAEEKGYDAVILYCFSDPVMEACRQAVSIPVIGGGQAACLMIPLVGYHGAVLLADDRRTPEKWIALQKTGLSMDRIAGFEAIHKKGLDPERDREELLQELAEAGKRAIEKTGCQVLVLGCLTFLGMAQELEERLGVPVVEPGGAAVSLAEAMVRQKLHSSRKAYLGKEDITYRP